jgi:Domain of unknown function (DUF4123)/Inner membrane component of T3SS, cytoplasmic domain
MRAIVEVPWGPHRGARVVLAPGEVLRVGRHAEGLDLPRDPQVSRVHFEIEWDGARCLVRDKRSMTGTLLNGEGIEEAEVRSGDFLRAGDTVVSVNFEGYTRRPPRPKIPGRRSNSVTRARKRSVLAALAAEKDTLFAVVDPTRSPRILQLLRESVEYSRSLYEGAAGDTLADVAPYLVQLPDKRSRLVTALVTEGLMRRWGVFLTSTRPFKDVRRHFRRFLVVREEDTGEKLYFRFYDPVVLRSFLPTCSVLQQREFFDEISAFLPEGDRGELLRFTLGAEEAEVVG